MSEINSIDYPKTLQALQQARDRYQKKLAKIEAAIEGVQALMEDLIADHAPQQHGLDRQPYSDLGLAHAAALALSGGKSMKTGDLWRHLERGGAVSTAQNPTNTLYSTLARHPERFERREGRWRLLAESTASPDDIGF